MYLTKEVEVWIDESDFEDALVPIDDLFGLLGCFDAVEALHAEYHAGSLWMCDHPACYSVNETRRIVGKIRERHEHPSLIALHEHGKKVRRLEQRRMS